MSREHSLGYATTCLNRYLSEQDISERFSPRELRLLAEYQNLKGHSNWKFRLNCAQLALKKLNDEHRGRFELTEYGVVCRSGAFYQRNLEESVQATKIFLGIWEKIMNENAVEQSMARELARETKLMIDKTFIKPTIEVVIHEMDQNGFQLQNPEATTQEASEILEHGLKLEFKNREGDTETMTFFLPGGQLVITDFNHGPGREHTCQEGAQKCLDAVRKVILECSKNLGMPIGTTTEGTPMAFSGAKKETQSPSQQKQNSPVQKRT